MADGTAPNVETEQVRDRVFGKFTGTVLNNLDPSGMGRLQASVPEVLGEVPTGWAKPCVPYAGPTSGFFSVPPIGAGVWLEFEAGDVSRPIWTGCYWGVGEVPMKPPGSPSQPTTKIWRSDFGLSAVLDDATQTITLTDSVGVNLVEVSVPTATVTIKSAARVVVDSALIQQGSAGSAHPAVLGDNLMKYLAQIVTLFNTHMHPGELAAGILPVTPAPPVMQLPLPDPSLLSVKVLLD